MDLVSKGLRPKCPLSPCKINVVGNYLYQLLMGSVVNVEELGTKSWYMMLIDWPDWVFGLLILMKVA